MNLEVVYGDLLDQDVDVIVNAWNRNIFPWWLLIPKGVSGAIKKRGGLEPFRELAKMKTIPLGHAVLTGPGTLRFKAIIHVAGINLAWTASKASIQDSVRSAMAIVKAQGYESVAFPTIGAGSGRFDEEDSSELILEALREIDFEGRVVLVRYQTELPSAGAS